jgi:glycosyltransferase involved in cell wall biosynthesis
MKPLRFCFLTTFYPPFSFGGDGIGVQRLAQALARRGHEVTVVHDRDAFDVLDPDARPDPAPPDPDGVRVVTLRSRLPMLSTLLTQQAGRPVMNGSRLRRLLDEGRFDVVNFHNVSLIGGPGLLEYGAGAAKLYLAHEHWLVCPTHVLWRHQRELCDGRQCVRCQISYHRPPQLWRHTGLLERQLDHVDAFIALSEFSRAKHREFGFPRDMDVLPYFVADPEEHPPVLDDPPPHPRPYFLFAGRLERIKGLDAVVELFARYPDADLVIAGGGDYGSELRQLAGGNARVRFLGRISPHQLAGYYRHAIALIVPSICFETFGNILVEAFSHATPVIARRLGPFPELLDRSGGGVLFDTIEDLLASMRVLQHTPGRRAEMGRSAFEACRAYWSESAVLPQYLGIVERVLGERAQAVH